MCRIKNYIIKNIRFLITTILMISGAYAHLNAQTEIETRLIKQLDSLAFAFERAFHLYFMQKQ